MIFSYTWKVEFLPVAESQRGINAVQLENLEIIEGWMGAGKKIVCLYENLAKYWSRMYIFMLFWSKMSK